MGFIRNDFKSYRVVNIFNLWWFLLIGLILSYFISGLKRVFIEVVIF